MKSQKGSEKMELPKNERQPNTAATKKKIWLYGKPFHGKSWTANTFPNVLFLSTDGNYKRLPGGVPPALDIVDELTFNGRADNRKMAWEVFLDALSLLERGENTFESIVLDNETQLRDRCREYVLKKMKIEHEADSNFGKGWSMIDKEWENAITRFWSLDYPNLLAISHLEDDTDVTKKSGEKISRIIPANSKKFMMWQATMVDIVGRCIDKDGNYVISFKTNEYIFGGGRLNTRELPDIPNTYEAICKVYEQANESLESVSRPSKKVTEEPTVAVAEVMTDETMETPETPKRRVKKRKDDGE